MKRLRTAALAAVAVNAMWNTDHPVFVSAFGTSPQYSGNRRLSDTTTERSYGQITDVDIARPSLYGGSSTAATLEKPSHIEVTEVPHSIAIPSSRKSSRHERMVRPKSLHSSSSKIESTIGLKKKKKESQAFPELLTRQEEVQLTQSIRTMRASIRVRDDLVSMNRNFEVGQLRREPTETQWADACEMSLISLRKAMKEGREARTKLVAANGGLVHSIAKKYYFSLKQANQGGGCMGTILTLQDMVQEGNLGLMEAAERFDPDRGCRFSTYATWWVRQRILRSISEYSRTIRLPAHVHTMLNKINKAKKQMQKEIGRAPSIPELSHYMEMSIHKLQMYTDSSRSVLSLEVPMSQGNSKGDIDRRTLGDKIASDSPTPVENAEVESMRRAIREVVNELADSERDVLVARFGLDDGSPRSLEETSKRLGISRDRVRSVEARALNKLRHPQRNYKLKEYVGPDADKTETSPKAASSISPERMWSLS